VSEVETMLVTSVLLADGQWHRAMRGSFSPANYPAHRFEDGTDFSFVDEDGSLLEGPMSSVLAVKRTAAEPVVAKPQRPKWCGECDHENSRFVEVPGTDSCRPCPRCHPDPEGVLARVAAGRAAARAQLPEQPVPAPPRVVESFERDEESLQGHDRVLLPTHSESSDAVKWHLCCPVCAELGVERGELGPGGIVILPAYDPDEDDEVGADGVISTGDHVAVTVFPDRDDYDSPIGTRGGYVEVKYWCADGHNFRLIVANHKGQEFLALVR
jgi:hypothetical protein